MGPRSASIMRPPAIEPRPFGCEKIAGMEATGFAVAIMAAGKGTRLKSKRPKVLHEVGGRALLLHVIAAARTLVRPEEIYCIIGHEAERVQAAVAQTGVNFVLQEVQRGTGHAMQVLKAWFELSGIEPPKHLLVLSGDVPLIRPETLGVAVRIASAEACRDDHPDRGARQPHRVRARVAPGRGSPEVSAIVEQKALTAGAAWRAGDQLRHLLLRNRGAVQQARSALLRQRPRRVLSDRRGRDAGRRRPARGCSRQPAWTRCWARTPSPR